MLHTVMTLGEIYPDGNMPTLDGIYFTDKETNAHQNQQIMSTNPQDFLNLGKYKGE